MRILKKQRLIILFAIAGLLFGASSCADDYFDPEPFSPNNNLQVSTYDFLAGQSNIFSLFVEIIDATNYKDSVNISGATVLAVNNDAVMNFLKREKINDIQEADLEELKALMGKYVFRKNLETTNVDSKPHEEMSVDNYPLVFSLRKDKWKSIEGVGPVVISVMDTKKTDSEQDDVVARVITSDIKTSSGVVLALDNDHVFGF